VRLYEPRRGFQETLRRLAIIHEGFVQDKARLGLDLARTSALDPKTAALLAVAAAVAINRYLRIAGRAPTRPVVRYGHGVHHRLLSVTTRGAIL